MIELIARARVKTGKQNKALRAENKIPAVLYGNKIKSMSLEVDYLPFDKLFHEAGESSIVTLNIDNKIKRNVLIKDYVLDPVKNKFNHIDFYEVNMTKKIKAKVALTFVGQSKVIKDDGGILVKNIQELEVSCLPGDLPKEITVDISRLRTFEDAIHVKDLVLPDKVEILTNKEEVVTTATPPRSEEELKELEGTVEEKVDEVEGVKKETDQTGTPEATEAEANAAPEKKDAKPKPADQPKAKKE